MQISNNKSGDTTAVIEHAQQRNKTLGSWSRRIWWTYVIGKILAYATGFVVPFGLAALAYIPKEHHDCANLILLVVAYFSIATQLILDALRFRDRAVTVRTVRAKLQTAIIQYNDGLIENAEVARVLEEIELELVYRNLP